ncbi:MAG: hypothetical protein MSC30_15080 [Gaiellaceae bacterium MAG52_C11]|nr:hypothetical protein [Candidatus Gaiellasilicea maunaloa]
MLAFGRLRAGVRVPIVVSATLAGCACLALIGSSITTDAATSWADLMFLVRLAKYLVVFCVVYVLATCFDVRSARFASAVLGLFGVAAAVGIAQYFNLLAINARLSPAYDDAALLQSGASWRRSFGTVGNSNYFGFLAAVGAAFAIWAALTMRRGIIAISAIVGSLCLFGVLVSGSRGAFLALGAMAAVILLTGIAGMKQRRRLLIGGTVIAAAGPTILNFLGAMPFANRFFFVWGVQDSNSLISIGLRRQLWEAELDRLEGHWIFGIGPQKGQLIQWVDNDFLRLTREFGLVTSIPYIALLTIGALLLLRRSFGAENFGGASLLSLAVLVGIATMGISADLFYHEQSMAVALVLLGLYIPRSQR